MRNAKDWLRLLIVPLALTASLPGRLTGADDLILRGQQSLIGPSRGAVVPFRRFPSRLWYFRAEGLGLKRDVSGDQSFAGLVTAGQTQTAIIRGDAAAGDDQLFERNQQGNLVAVLDQQQQDIFVNVTVTQQPGSVTSALGTQDLNFEFQGGYQLLLGCRLCGSQRLEFLLFDLNDWDERTAVRDVTANDVGTRGNLFSPFTNFGNPPVQGLDYNNLVSLAYSSRLDNMELNWWSQRPMPPGGLQVSYLLGARYLNLLEEFQYFSASESPAPGGSTSSVDTRAGNALFGAQIGALLMFPVDPCWWIDWELKGAICHNRADQNTWYATANGGGAQQQFWSGRRENRTTFVGETSVMLIYELTRKLTVRVGYQAIWVEGVALASENVNTDTNILMSGPAILVHDGAVVYHGPHLGLTWMW